MIFNMPSKQLQISNTLPALRDSFFFFSFFLSFFFSILLPFQDQFLLQKYCSRAVCLKAPAPSKPHPRSNQTHGPLAGDKGGWVECCEGGVETSHCCRVTSVVITNAGPNPTHSGHHPLMTMLAMSLDKTVIPCRERTATSSLSVPHVDSWTWKTDQNQLPPPGQKETGASGPWSSLGQNTKGLKSPDYEIKDDTEEVHSQCYEGSVWFENNPKDRRPCLLHCGSL